jgi:phosphatidylglycerophosphatase C
MQQIAIYDLDRTLLRKPTFTPFLLFAARRTVPWRLLLLPIWILAMIGYRLGFYGRKPLKQFGFRLLVGSSLPDKKFMPVIAEFARLRIARDYGPAAQKSVQENRQSGARIVIATAAPEIYAREIGRQMGIDDVIATQHMRMAGSPGYLARFDGENCYGTEKLRRIELWFKEQKLQRQDCIITSYSDHPSDAPMLDWSDQAVLVTRSVKLGQAAHKNGWAVLDFG